jgi:hypothetical protein
MVCLRLNEWIVTTTHQKRLGQLDYLVFGEEAVFVVIVLREDTWSGPWGSSARTTYQVEKPLYGLHQTGIQNGI